MAKLTERQKRFADEYLKIGNASEASKRAGYSRKYAGTNADKLLKNTNVAEYIESRNRELNRNNIAEMQEVKEFWTDTMRNGQLEMRDRLKASESLARTEGAFIERNILQTENKTISETVKEMEAYLDELA